MATCTNEIIGLSSIKLHINNNVIFYRPDISVLDEINLVVSEAAYLTVSDFNQLSRWERTIDYSGNYKQSYQDNVSFVLHGIENSTPGTLKEIRENRLGYIIEIALKNGKSYVFQSPFFVSEANTKQINSHSWQVVLRYRQPAFKDRLENLAIIINDDTFDSTFTTFDSDLITFDKL